MSLTCTEEQLSCNSTSDHIRPRGTVSLDACCPPPHSWSRGGGKFKKVFSIFAPRSSDQPSDKNKNITKTFNGDGIYVSVFQLKRKGKNTELGEGGLPHKKQSHHQARHPTRVDDIIAQNLMIIITHRPISMPPTAATS
jgi:hypothetical protein